MAKTAEHHTELSKLRHKGSHALTRAAAIVFAGILFTGSPAFCATFSSASLGLQFEVPAQWTASEAVNELDFIGMFVMPPSEEARRTFAVGMQITRDSGALGPMPSTLADIGQYFRNQLEEQEVKYAVISEEDVTIAGQPAKRIVYTHHFDNVPEQARHVEYHFLRDGSHYIVEFSSVESQFEKYWQEAKTVVDTMQVLS